MKRSWTTILLIFGLVGLLVLLGTLQFRWLTQISRSEGEKAHQRVQEQADHFAMDFNREIQNAYFNFQTEPESWKTKDWAPFNERYDYWREKTNYPSLITDFYFFEVKSDAQPLCYDPGTRAFNKCRDTEAVAELRAKVEGDKPFRAIYEDTYTLVMPIQDIGQRIENVVMRRVPDNIPQPVIKMPDNFAYLAITLDPDTIMGQIIPDLTAKYFGDGEFNVGVDDRQGKPVIASIDPSTTDASAKLLDLSPDNFIFFANKDLMSSIDDKHESLVINSRMERGSFKRIESADDHGKTLKIEVQDGPKPRTQIFTSTSGPTQQSPWTLVVQHVSGSLDAAVAATLRRNLAVGFGILLLLAGAIAAIIISAQRAKTVARRQIDFVSSVSHEFRTPLAVIYSASENLADGVAKENTQVASYGNLIKAEGKKLSGMVEQILDFAGANSGRRKYSFTDTPVGDIISHAVEECRPLIEEKGVDLDVLLSDGLPHIRVDKAALSQAIQNLIANSIKYCNGSSWLRLSAENGGGNIRITVEDHGIGIAKGELKQIFEPFYRSKSVVDAQIHGNGLGLSLVHQIVTAHDGKISVESELGKGSKFTVVLPLTPA